MAPGTRAKHEPLTFICTKNSVLYKISSGWPQAIELTLDRWQMSAQGQPL
jgi:hypothetical protein